MVEAMGGGVFTYITELANILVKSYDMYIAYGVREQTPLDFKDCFAPDIHLIEVKSFTRSVNPVKDLAAVSEVKRIAEEVKPDIIHLHSSKAGAIGRVAFSGKKVPLFYTPHGYSFLMQNYKPLKRGIFRMVETVLAKGRCTTISCSYGEHQETLKLTSRATYVNNGIDTADLDKFTRSVRKQNHPFTVFTLGRICYQKNPALFNSIAEAMPDTRFLWIGDGELRSNLKARNIEITGWVDRNKAMELSMNADVFLLTSLWEGLPISLLESMYMEKLCVVTDVIGSHDVISNGVNGFVCSNVNEFVNAISTPDVSPLIKRAKEDIEEEYNAKTMADRYVEIYERKTGWSRK